MTETILHFGMHKTGSTSIQKTLFTALDDPSFYYLRFEQANLSRIVNLLALNDEHLHPFMQRLGVSRNDLGKLRKLIADRLKSEYALAAGRIAILSAESISNLTGAEFEVLLNELRLHSARFRAVGYIRRPQAYMESMFQEAVKHGRGTLMPVDRFYPRYRRRFKKLVKSTSLEAASLWLFEPRLFKDGCVVRDFSARLGIKLDVERVFRVNESLSLEALSLLFAYRRYGPSFGVGPKAIKENMQLYKKLTELKGTRISFHPDLVDPVLKQNRDDITWMEERLGTSLKEGARTPTGKTIRADQDLLTFDRDTLAWLGKALGPQFENRVLASSSPRRLPDGCRHYDCKSQGNCHRKRTRSCLRPRRLRCG